MNDNPAALPIKDKQSDYSKAFELMTQGNHNDLVGLVAYARYKQMVRDEVIQGVRLAGTPKNPSAHVVEFYRMAAQQQLQEFATASIDEARAEIQESALLNRFEAATGEIKGHISSSTGAWRSVWTNVIAWSFTLLISLLVLLSLRMPGVEDKIDRALPKNESAAGSP